MSQTHEPPHRRQRWPLPDPSPVLEQAAQRRREWLQAMRSVSHSAWSEDERRARLDNSPTED